MTKLAPHIKDGIHEYVLAYRGKNKERMVEIENSLEEFGWNAVVLRAAAKGIEKERLNKKG